MPNREVVITTDDGEKYATKFDTSEVKDSEALHYLLSLVDPGEHYTVEFQALSSVRS